MNITIPTTNDIGNTLERIARTIAILIAAAMAAGAVTRSALATLANLANRLTRRPLRTLIEMVPTMPEPTPDPLLAMLGAELLTDAQLLGEIARYDASTKRKSPATAKPNVRRKPGASPRTRRAAAA